MDSIQVEKHAVNAVSDCLLNSDYLDPCINSNDKEPSWDGTVYVYSKKNKTKKYLKGRVPIQVKGKQCNNFPKKTSYPMSLDDLQNYLIEGGTILFVVLINTTGQTKIYYSSLIPEKLKPMIKKATEKQHGFKNIELNEFPVEKVKIANVFFYFLQNSKRQKSFVDDRIYTLEEFINKGILKSIEIPFEHIGSFDIESAFFDNEVCVYAKIKGTDVLHPVGILPKDKMMLINEIPAKISVGNRVFYDKFKRVYRNKETERIEVKIGKSINLTWFEDKSSYKIDYVNSSSFRTMATDLDFYLSILKQGYFEIEGRKLLINCNDMKFTNTSIEKEEKRLEFVKRSVQVLDILNCKYDIEWTELKKDDFRKLELLANALIDNLPITGLPHGLNYLQYVEVGKLSFLMFFKEDDTEQGKYSVYDFLNTGLHTAIEGENGKMIMTSPYRALNKDVLLKISNLQCDKILSSFQQVNSKEIFIEANLYLLELLKAYDASNDKRMDLLSVAKEIAIWIKKESQGNIDNHIITLNYYQILKRGRLLNEDEKSELQSIHYSGNLMSKVGACLLLDLQLFAKDYYDKLSEQEQRAFKTYPIWRFWK